MKTLILKPSKETYMLCSELARNGEIVAFPTETVYGLGANALDGDAVKKIFEAKGRPQDNPLIVHVGRKEDISKYVKSISPTQQILIDKFMPGPISIIFEKADCISDVVTAGGNTVAIRLPENKVAQDFINACDLPICAPSANTSKRPSPTNAKHVYDDMNEKIPVIIDGGETEVGIESTVVKVENNTIYILRAGRINKEMLVSATGLKVVDKLDNTKIPQSPGTKYTHYKPKCNMVLVKNDIVRNSIALYEEAKQNGKRAIIFTSSENENKYGSREVKVLGKDSNEASHNLFNYLREVENNYDLIIAQYFSNGDIIDGLFNRMIKASSGKII